MKLFLTKTNLINATARKFESYGTSKELNIDEFNIIDGIIELYYKGIPVSRGMILSITCNSGNNNIYGVYIEKTSTHIYRFGIVR